MPAVPVMMDGGAMPAVTTLRAIMPSVVDAVAADIDLRSTLLTATISTSLCKAEQPPQPWPHLAHSRPRPSRTNTEKYPSFRALEMAAGTRTLR